MDKKLLNVKESNLSGIKHDKRVFRFPHLIIQFLLILVAFIFGNISFVNSDTYNIVVPTALIIAIGTMIYIIAVWRKQGWFVRIESLIIGLVALWVIYDGCFRMLW